MGDTEVKKLQELVKKLEIQNQILKTESKPVEHSKPRLSDEVFVDEAPPKPRVSFPAPAADDDEPLPLAGDLSNDEEWLLRPPYPESVDHDVSPADWLREELDSPDLLRVRRALVNKLNEFALTGRLSLTPAVVVANGDASDLANGTFRRQSRKSSYSARSGKDMRAFLRSSASQERLHDLTDVQIMAKMQFEELREQVNLSRSRTSISSSQGSLDDLDAVTLHHSAPESGHRRRGHRPSLPVNSPRPSSALSQPAIPDLLDRPASVTPLSGGSLRSLLPRPSTPRGGGGRRLPSPMRVPHRR